MDALIMDLRHALRMLARSPGFTLVALGVLALGIGANTALYSVVRGVLLEPLPFPRSERLVAVYESQAKRPQQRGSVSDGNLVDWREQGGSLFEQVGSYINWRARLGGAGELRQARIARVSAGFFPALGVAPALGRTLRPDEEQPGRDHVVVLSHGLWTRSFGADPGVVGRTLSLDGIPCTIVGVMPPTFRFPEADTELWTPYALDPASAAFRVRRWQWVVARLRPDVSLEGARAGMAALARRLQEAHPVENAGVSAKVVTLQEHVVGDVRAPLWVLFGAVGFVLLIACGNVANLLLARASGRRRELAVRAALGAGRAALVRGLLVESWVLALGGAVLGLLLALWGTDALVAALPQGMPRAQEVQVDGGVLAFTLLLAFLVGTLFGLAPALQLPEGSLHAAVGGAAGASAGPRARRLRRALIGAEVAVSMLLLVGAGLMLRSLQRLQDAPLGFRTDGVASVSLSLAGARYADPQRVAALTRGFVDEVRALPGVEGAALVAFQPLTGSSVRQPFLLAGKPAPPPGERNLAQMNMVTPGYFAVMGIALRRGRDLSSAEGVPGAPPAVVVNEAFVRRFLPGEEPLGQGIGFENTEPGDLPFTIVGVVGDVRHDGPGQEPPPQMYFHLVQNTWSGPQLVLRAHGNLAQLAAGVQAAVRRVDPEQAASDFKPLDGLVAGAVAEPRFRTLLLGGFALVALLLSAVGIFGVVSYAVGQRTRELGIRMAIGARGADVVRLVLRGELLPVGVGLALGALGAWAGTRALASLLYGVSAQDPLAFVGALLVLAGAALLASWLPARRATRIDPVLALRSE